MENYVKPRVLVAEDDAQLNRLVVTWLRRADIEVDSVYDGEHAIAALKEKQYSAVLLDVMMPRVTGIGVIDYVAAHQPKLLSNIVVMTAGGEGVVDQIKRHPVRHIVAKPFDLHDILEAALDCARARAADLRTAGGGKGRLLVVDDDEAWRYLMAKPLMKDFNVEFAESGSEAIDRLKQDDFDAVLLDIHMPGLDGTSVIQYLEEHQRHFLDRVVVVTIAPDKVEDLPVADVLGKPFEADALVKLLQTRVLKSH